MKTARFMQPNYIIALLFDYLVESTGMEKRSRQIGCDYESHQRACRKTWNRTYETPVGFKYIGELIKRDKILIGGEESAGLRSANMFPEKDGVLAGLLCCEMVRPARRIPRANNWHNLFAKVGSFYPLRENFRLTPEVKEKFTEKLRSDPGEFHGTKVAQVGEDGRTQTRSRRRIVGMLPAFGDGTSSARIQRSAQQGRPREIERGGESMDLRLGPRREYASFHGARKACAQRSTRRGSGEGTSSESGGRRGAVGRTDTSGMVMARVGVASAGNSAAHFC